MDILKELQEEFGITQSQAENTVRLLDEGNTVPFIARYRKELHGAMDDTALRTLEERLGYLRGLEERRAVVKNAIDELRALGAKHIELRPMMLVAGDRAQNDMAGDDADSWKSHLTAAGFDVHCTVEGLGELEDVQRLYVEHLKAELK